MSDNTMCTFGGAFAVFAFCFLVFNVRTCTQAYDAEREKTKQEAIKAGLVEGEFGRWVKPEVKP